MTSSAFAGVRTASSPNGSTPRAPAVEPAPARGTVEPAPAPVVDERAPACGVEPARSAVASFDSTRFRAVLGHFATGVVAITAVDPVDGVPTGLAANSFTSVSLDPPLVAFCVAHTSTTWPTLRVARRLCVNVLGAEQLGICKQFATKGADKFCGVDWGLSPAGAPVLDDALAWVECGIEAEYEAGDHVIVLCQVHDLGHRQGPAPLVFYRGGYGSFAG